MTTAAQQKLLATLKIPDQKPVDGAWLTEFEDRVSGVLAVCTEPAR